MAYEWGSKFRWEDNDESPPTVKVTVKETEDWGKLWVLDPRKELREALRCVEILARELYGMPFIYTIPSPFVQALHGVSEPERVYTDMKENPDALREGLEIITQTTIDFAKEVIAEGATGVFFGIGSGGDIWFRMTRARTQNGVAQRSLSVFQYLSDLLCLPDGTIIERNEEDILSARKNQEGNILYYVKITRYTSMFFANL